MKLRLGSFFFTIVLLWGCTQPTMISFSCEKDKKEDYVLRWEVFPERENKNMDIYISDNDSIFPKVPSLTAPVTDYMAVMKQRKSNIREYFRLKVDKTYSGIISNRYFEMDSVQNLRDLGGYFTDTDKQIRWGKVFRSGTLARTSQNDVARLQSLNIKTVIDLREEGQAERYPDQFNTVRYIQIPINASSFEAVTHKIKAGNLLRGDAVVYLQDLYKTVIDDYAPSYAQLLDELSKEENYPILFHCVLGKDVTGLASYFLLTALDVPSDIIEDDYLLSNSCIDKRNILGGAEYMPESMQEAITMISHADASYIRYAVSCMKKKSGSVDQYMTNELKMNPEKKMRLKKILLYPN